MTHPYRSRLADTCGARILAFPVSESAQPHPELPGLAFGSPENLILQATHVLERVVRIAGSLNDSQRVDVLGHLLALETQVLNPLQEWVERRRTVLSDISAKQAKKRRRRQKRVKNAVLGQILPAVLPVLPILSL